MAREKEKSRGHIEKSSFTKAPSTERAVCPLLALSLSFLLTPRLSEDVKKYLLFVLFKNLQQHKLQESILPTDVEKE